MPENSVQYPLRLQTVKTVIAQTNTYGLCAFVMDLTGITDVDIPNGQGGQIAVSVFPITEGDPYIVQLVRAGTVIGTDTNASVASSCPIDLYIIDTATLQTSPEGHIVANGIEGSADLDRPLDFVVYVYPGVTADSSCVGLINVDGLGGQI